MRISWLKLSHTSNEKSLSSEGSPNAPSACSDVLRNSTIGDTFKFWSFLIASVYFYVNHLIVCLFILQKSADHPFPAIKGAKENKNTEKIKFISKGNSKYFLNLTIDDK